MKYNEIITETEAELKQLKEKQKLAQFQKRIHFLLLLKSGNARTQAEAGKTVGWKLRQSQKIWQLYREKGVTNMLHKNARWQIGKLSREQRQELREYITEKKGLIALATVRDYITANFGISYSIGGVSNLCRRLKLEINPIRSSNKR